MRLSFDGLCSDHGLVLSPSLSDGKFLELTDPLAVNPAESILKLTLVMRADHATGCLLVGKKFHRQWKVLASACMRPYAKFMALVR